MTEKEREVSVNLQRSSQAADHASPPGPPPASNGPTSVMTPPTPITIPAPPFQTPYWKTKLAPPQGNFFEQGVRQGVIIEPPKTKSVLEAYLLCLIFGFIGAHHFYLGRPMFGVLYLFSFGLFGCGWVVDLLRMPCLVSRVNQQNSEKHQQLVALQQQMSQQHQQGQLPAPRLPSHHVVYVAFEPRSLGDAYILWFPCGLFGFHHFYLRNYGMGFLYLFTLGLLGIGWLVDAFRLPFLVRQANSNSPMSPDKTYNHCTAHILALSPAGILGGHHYYLDRPVWGILYTLTLGLLGIGWIWDWFRTSCLVKRANNIRQGFLSPSRKFLDDAYLLCLLFGWTGLHHFYLHRYGWGALYFFTLGLMGLGWLVDCCRLPCLVNDFNKSMEESHQRLLGANTVVVTAAQAPSPNYSGVLVSHGNPPVAGAFNGVAYPTAYGAGYPVPYQAGAPSMYPGLVYEGPYPTYLGPQAAGAAMPYPPSARQGTVPAPPSYEASQGTQSKEQ